MRWNLRDWLTGGKGKTLEELHGRADGTEGATFVAKPVSWTPAREARPTPPSGGSGVPATSPVMTIRMEPPELTERRKGMTDLLKQITDAVKGLVEGSAAVASVKADVADVKADLKAAQAATQAKLDALAARLDAILVNQANLEKHVGMGTAAGVGDSSKGGVKA